MCEVCTEAVHSVAFGTRVTSQVWTCGEVYYMYRNSPYRSIRNTSYITGLDIGHVWGICTKAVHSVAVWTRVTSQVWTCVKYVPKQSIRSILNTGYITGLDMCEVWTEAVHSVEFGTRVTSQVSTCDVKMYRSSPFRSSLKHELHHGFGHVWRMHRSSPFRRIWNTGYITGLDMWCKNVPKQSIPQHFEHGLHHRFGHVRSMYRNSPFRSLLNTSYISGLDMGCKNVPKQSIPQHFEHGSHHRFGHVRSMYRSSPFRSLLNTSYISG